MFDAKDVESIQSTEIAFVWTSTDDVSCASLPCRYPLLCRAAPGLDTLAAVTTLMPRNEPPSVRVFTVHRTIRPVSELFCPGADMYVVRVAKLFEVRGASCSLALDEAFL